MDQLRVLLDKRLISRSDTGLVYVGLSLQVNGFTFPAPSWTDSIVVLSWWCEAATRLLSQTTDFEKMRFMEGPYYFEIVSASPDTWQLTCMESALRQNICRHRGEVVINSFIETLLEAADSALTIVAERSWWSIDADSLLSTTALLRERLGLGH